MLSLLSIILFLKLSLASEFTETFDENELRVVEPPELLRSNSTPGTPRYLKRIMSDPVSRSRSVTVTDSVVQIALLAGNPDEALKLLESSSPANLYGCNIFGKDIFAMAYEHRFSHPELFRAAITHPEFQVNRIRKDGLSLLHFLVLNEDIEMLAFLFDRYRDTIDTNIIGTTGITPLGLALEHPEVFEFMLNEAPGLNVMVEDAYGISCFSEAIHLEKWDLVQKMIERPEAPPEIRSDLIIQSALKNGKLKYK